jgi:hypothetical protein
VELLVGLVLTLGVGDTEVLDKSRFGIFKILFVIFDIAFSIKEPKVVKKRWSTLSMIGKHFKDLIFLNFIRGEYFPNC